ncbi:MAG: ABC transporter permease [Candidatus Carbobacillus altaicus]|nr:ABC transporter permease [Candidatus Carbobacillus altaicus]
MKLRTLRRHLRDAFRSFLRNGWMSFASVATVAITLFLVGVFILAALNIDHLARQTESQVEVSIYLKMDTSQDEIRKIEADLNNLPHVHSVRFVPREEGLAWLKETYADEADLFVGLDEDNPLPDAFFIKTDEPARTAELAQTIQSWPQVETVRYAQEEVAKLLEITTVIRQIMLVVVIGLALTATFLISNTIKLTIVSRREEVEVMRLVGASKWYIRMPYFIEGALIGLLGAGIPLLLLVYLYQQYVENTEILSMSVLSMQSVTVPLIVALFGIGLLIGIWGSLSSIRKFLRT